MTDLKIFRSVVLRFPVEKSITAKAGVRISVESLVVLQGREPAEPPIAGIGHTIAFLLLRELLRYLCC